MTTEHLRVKEGSETTDDVAPGTGLNPGEHGSWFTLETSTRSRGVQILDQVSFEGV
jgi:hypothetical protein